MDAERKALYEKARGRIQDKALALMEKHLETVDEKFEGGNLGHQAQALRVFGEIGSVGGYGAKAGPVAMPAALSINFNSAETVASFVEALRMLNEPSGGRVIEVKAEEG
jgi:hypothetical protein